MLNVLVDLHRIGKNPYNGLYTYCYQLGKSLLKFEHRDLNLFYYLPQDKFGFFGKEIGYVNQRSIDKFYRFNTYKYDIWHAATTLSWYKPFNKKTKFIFTIHDLNFMIENPDNAKINNRNLRLIQERVNRADHIIAISKTALQQANQYLTTGDKPISIVYPGCALVNELPGEKIPAFIPSESFLFTIGLLPGQKSVRANVRNRLLAIFRQLHEYRIVRFDLGQDSAPANGPLPNARTPGLHLGNQGFLLLWQVACPYTLRHFDMKRVPF